MTGWERVGSCTRDSVIKNRNLGRFENFLNESYGIMKFSYW